MKKFLATIVLSVLASFSYACEICGCGVGNYYIGIMPQFTHGFVGMRYQFNSFRTRLNNDPSQFSKDFYQTVELWGGWNLGKRLQLIGIIPYNFNHQASDEGDSHLNGLGDAVFLLNYKILEGHKKNVNQELWIGSGVKFPTGKFAIEDGDPDVAAVANNQRGSGSADFLVSTTYNIRVSQWAFTTNATYKINQANQDEYKFGNKISASSFVSYTTTGKTAISPNIGLMYQHTKESQLNKTAVDLTGGSIFQVATGIELGFNKIAVGFNTQLPIIQNFADGQTKSKLKGMAHITFAL